MEEREKKQIEIDLKQHFKRLENDIKNAESHSRQNSFGIPLYNINSEINSATNELKHIKQILRMKFKLNI